MTFRTVGDLAQTFLANRQTVALKAELRRHASELATGRAADLSARLSGDFTVHAALTRGRALAEAQGRALAEARLLAEAAQSALGTVQEAVEAASARLLSAAGQGGPADLARAGAEARRGFEAAVAALNLRLADRAAFAGAATDRPPLAPADAILAHLAALTAAAPTAADAIAAVDGWFDAPGGGFETLAYRGSAADLAPVPLGTGESAAPPPRADDPALRQALKALALGALIGTAAAADPGAAPALARAAGERALAATGGVIGLRAALGAAEAALAAAEARAAAEAAAGERALADLVAADPYEAATRLEAAQSRLEALQALTVRLARLSLAELLR